MYSVIPLFLAVLASEPAQAQSCVTATTVEDVHALLAEAENAYLQDRPAMLDVYAEMANEGLRCLQERVDRDLAARFHRLQGLRAYAQEREEAAIDAFTAARGARPFFELSEAYYHDDTRLLECYHARSPTRGTWTSVPPSSDGHLYFDARLATVRDTSKPTILQIVGYEGTILLTTWLSPEMALPAYGMVTPRPSPRRFAEMEQARRNRDATSP